jgi:hypothetical protein
LAYIPWYIGITNGGLLGRAFKGQVHVRIPPNVHEEVAKEAFEKGTSISGIFAQALTVRKALRNINPWKSIAEVREANSGLSEDKIESAVEEAIRAVRNNKRRRA